MSCFVCENGVGSLMCSSVKVCSEKCQKEYNLLHSLANAIEDSERKAKPKGLVAYSDMSLFEPVDLGKLMDDDDEPKEEKYVLPVVIEALPAFDIATILLVKMHEGKHRFAPGKNGAIKFYDVNEAKKYIAEELKPYYAEKYNFLLWSESALV